MWMQPTCEIVKESSTHPQSDVESNRTSNSESIKDYAFDETDYEDLSDNESITDLNEQVRQLEEESGSLSRTLDEKIDNLESRIGGNNMIRRQQAGIYRWLDYEFDELMESMEAERRRILGQDALYTIWGKENEINPGS